MDKELIQLVVAFRNCMRKFKMGCVIDSEDTTVQRTEVRTEVRGNLEISNP
jgi:hypothetical protein